MTADLTTTAESDTESNSSVPDSEVSDSAVSEGTAGDAPFWRRPRRLRRQLAWTLVGTALVSLLLVGLINYFAARTLLQDGSEDQLVSVAESRAGSIEQGIDRLLGRMAGTAADRAVSTALTRFGDAFDALDEAPLEPEQEADLDTFYQEVVLDPLAAVGIDQIAMGDVAPTSAAGRYLQYHYTLPGPDEVDRISVTDPGDGSEYSSVHADFHPFFSGFVGSGGIDDVLLISTSGDVVYSARKRIDLGVNLFSGRYAESTLTRAIYERLPRVRSGEAILTDVELSLAAGGRPEFYSVALVRDDTEVVGAVAVAVTVEALSAITTAQGDWEGVGLGDGESYIVGRDQRLRSESRLWIEDPEAYLEAVDDPELAGFIEVFDSPILLQPVDTAPVRTALTDATFSGPAENYLGESTYAYARQIDAGGNAWVVVAEVPNSQVQRPLVNYALVLVLVLAIVLPAAAVVGYVLADRLTRAIPTVVEMASDIAEGERELDVPDLGANEFGDLARRLGQMSGELGRQEQALAQEFEQRRQLLLTVLPPRLVKETGDVEGSGGAIGIGTVISVSFEVNAIEHDEHADELQRRFGNAAESRAEELGIERIRTAHDRLLFLAGFDDPDDGADSAVDFAIELASRAESLDETGHTGIDLHIGLATGAVATGVLQRGSLTFTVWGEPVRQALAIGALSISNEILVDQSTVAAMAERSRLSPATDVIALDGEPMVLYSVVGPEG